MRYLPAPSCVFLSLLCVCLLPATGFAETVYVIDKLLVGVHKEKAVDSAIVKVLPTGTRLEVLERDGELALVKGPEGAQGWVDAGYLMTEIPAALVVDRLTEEKRALEQALAKAKKAAAGNASAKPVAEENPAPSETTGNGEMEQKLVSERLKVGELQARISELQSDKDRLNEELTSVPGLREKIGELQAQLSTYEEAGGNGGNTVMAIGKLMLGSKPAVLVLAGLLLSAFLIGVYVMDSLQRKRHGGYRL